MLKSLDFGFKGIFHPKMKILTQKKILQRLLVTKRSMVSSIGGMLWKSLATSNCLVTKCLQNIYFCVQQIKYTYTGLAQLKGDDRLIDDRLLNDDIFGVLNCIKLSLKDKLNRTVYMKLSSLYTAQSMH